MYARARSRALFTLCQSADEDERERRREPREERRWANGAAFRRRRHRSPITHREQGCWEFGVSVGLSMNCEASCCGLELEYETRDGV